ncbi:hypothetical protein A8709_23190 [Paenibacillus pectinilyticus]|uniref:Spore germination protein N-terminal domain-containing protein n=1 Tax=Paenibacillus pectinilyticus TaxID=512399 RepID=A0A1C0ZRQ1_9BACL|nr:hypothetical protein A8709_23190 [Paenibacillus pectinilyticus]
MMCVLLLSGCWSRNEFNDIAIAEEVGIDIAGDQFEFSVQIVNPDSMSKTKGDQALPIIIYAAKGSTLNEAVKRLASSMSRKVYFSHIRILVLSEELAQRGVSKSMDYLQRRNEFRSDFKCDDPVGIQIVGNTASGTGTNKSNINFVTPPVRLRYFGNGVFKNDRLVGWLNENESHAYSIITDHSKPFFHACRLSSRWICWP